MPNLLRQHRVIEKSSISERAQVGIVGVGADYQARQDAFARTARI